MNLTLDFQRHMFSVRSLVEANHIKHQNTLYIHGWMRFINGNVSHIIRTVSCPLVCPLSVSKKLITEKRYETLDIFPKKMNADKINTLGLQNLTLLHVRGVIKKFWA